MHFDESTLFLFITGGLLRLFCIEQLHYIICHNNVIEEIWRIVRKGENNA